MLAERPLVSVLVAAYNAERWVLETVASALGQTYEHLEVIVVDDGSTDGTVSCVEAIDDPRLRVIRQENRGACAARNRAYQASTGDLIQYLDADDVLHPEKLARQVARLTREPAWTVASGPWVRFEGAVANADHTYHGPDWRDYAPATDWLLQAWGVRGGMTNFAWLTPRAVAEAAGPWDERALRNQDGEYFARVLVNATKVAFCEGAWGYYRVGGPTNVSHRVSDAALRSLFNVTAQNESTLLSRIDTPAARRACGVMWQGVAFTLYPRLPDLCDQAEARAYELGAPPRDPGTIPSVRPILRLFGWKAALRVQHLYNRLRHRTL